MSLVLIVKGNDGEGARWRQVVALFGPRSLKARLFLEPRDGDRRNNAMRPDHGVDIGDRVEQGI